MVAEDTIADKLQEFSVNYPICKDNFNIVPESSVEIETINCANSDIPLELELADESLILENKDVLLESKDSFVIPSEVPASQNDVNENCPEKKLTLDKIFDNSNDTLSSGCELTSSETKLSSSLASKAEEQSSLATVETDLSENVVCSENKVLKDFSDDQKSDSKFSNIASKDEELTTEVLESQLKKDGPKTCIPVILRRPVILQKLYLFLLLA